MGITLVVLAAGMGSRFGGRIKQLEPLGPKGELLMDYSVYDALEAGFDKAVFIIRPDMEALFKEKIGDRISRYISTEYVYQTLDNLPCRRGDFPSRTKPWGTAQALYCCKDTLKRLGTPFGIVNADDFYGRGAFTALAGFLKDFKGGGCSVNYPLCNTLSDYGAVNRGVCRSDGSGHLTSVEETKGIKRGGDGIIKGTYNGAERTLDENCSVSMSMWGFGADFMPLLEKRLSDFLKTISFDEPKAELTIADAVGAEIRENGFLVSDIPTDSRWFGITYESDAVHARETIKADTDKGIYPCPLWK